MIISQGDQYGIPVIFKIDGQIADPSLFSNIEIVIGNIRKDFNSGVTYSELEKAWIFPLTQEESLKLTVRKQPGQLRAKFTSGDVCRASLGEIDVEESKSKVVL